MSDIRELQKVIRAMTPDAQEHLAYVLRFHTEMAVKLCPPSGRMGFIFGSLCSAAGIEDDEFYRLLDLAMGATDA